MVNQTASFERLILDVFEEYEDAFYFPLQSQKDARAFVKAMHMKGVPYEQIYEAIGEFEHNFSSWKSGLGRPGIGSRIIDLINRPLFEVLEDEDSLPSNGLQTNGYESKQEVRRSWEDNHRVPPMPHGQEKTSRSHITTTTDAKNKDVTNKVTGNSKTTTTTTKEPASPKSPVNVDVVDHKSQSSPVKSIREPEQTKDSEKKEKEKKEEAPKRMVELRRTPPRQEKRERPVSELERMKQQILSKKQDETDLKQPTERERSSSRGSTSESESGSSDSDVKVDAVLGKFDAIKINDSPVQEEPPKKPDRLFLDEKVEEKENKESKSVKTPEIKSPEQSLREERKEAIKKMAASGQIPRPAATASAEDVDENYNSDLDPDNENQSPVMATLVKKISAMRAAGKNSTGFVYVLSDSARDSTGTEVRIKVSSSKCPTKRTEQARCFNPDIWLVSTFPVSQRISALKDIQAQLAGARLAGSSGWFTGALDDLLQIIQDCCNKYPSKTTVQDATTGQSES